MKKLLGLLLLVSLIAGCSSKPAPAWIAAGHQQIEAFKRDFLTGQSPQITELHFRKATEEIKKSGDLDLLGKAWLTRMALQAAVLEEVAEGEYGKIEAAAPSAANRNYYLFLTGKPGMVDDALLPAQYRPFLKALQSGDAAAMAGRIAEIDDPLSRLIAAGLAMRSGPANEPLLQAAIETASQNGWKRALIAWLERLSGFYERSGEAAKAATVRQRLDLIK
ncbi:MAG: hypothetical protein ACYDAA_18515 [Syntrophales bacterium]